MRTSLLAVSSILCLGITSLKAEVKLPAIFSDHMVLKRAAKVPVWGSADPGEEINVTLGGRTTKTKAGDDGTWRTELDLSGEESGPFEMEVNGKNRIKVTDVLIGDVWLASGQSNMEYPLKGTLDAAREIAGSANPQLRQFLVKKATSATPLGEMQGTWTVAGPETSGNFSAVAYYFGKTLQNELKRPVGIIHSSWGGTPVEAWTSGEALATVPDLKEGHQKQLDSIDAYPGRNAAWVERFGKWLGENHREDKPATEVTACATGPTEGWRKVKLDGKLADAGLPQSGVIWLRKTIEIPPSKEGKAIPFEFNLKKGFETVYWNGEEVQRMTWRDYPGENFPRRFGKVIGSVPGEKVKPGTNTVAIRVFVPAGPATILGVKFSDTDASDGWSAAAESELPPLTPEQAAAVPQAPVTPEPQHAACHLFNAMIHPLIPYAIKGVIWYQGEANAERAFQYRTSFPLMISDWRRRWGQGDFPFYFCQLANYQDKPTTPGDCAWAELREAQSLALKLPNTGQAVLIDVGDAKDIHPRNKRTPGERLAAIALAKDYGVKQAFSGPVFRSAGEENGRIRVSFDHADGGLVARPVPETYVLYSKDNTVAPTVRNSPGSEIEGFAVCGEDGKWVWADARIDGETVVVWSEKVPKPVAVRYGWANNPTLNLCNRAGFPAAPFRSDDFPAVTRNTRF